MSTATFDTARIRVAGSKAAVGRRGFFRAFHDRMLEWRAEQARAVIRQHIHLLPRELEQAGWRISERSEDSLPFAR